MPVTELLTLTRLRMTVYLNAHAHPDGRVRL
jgi:hypothetical protein